MGWHTLEEHPQLRNISFIDLYLPDFADHAEDASSKLTKRDIDARQRHSLRVEDELREPLPHDTGVAEEALEQRLKCRYVDERLVYVEYDHCWSKWCTQGSSPLRSMALSRDDGFNVGLYFKVAGILLPKNAPEFAR